MSQTSLGTCRWINKAHSSTWIYSYSMRGTKTAKVEGQWPPSNWPKCSVPKTQTTAQRLVCTFLIYPFPDAWANIVTSLNDITIICSPSFHGKSTVHVQGIALIHLHTCTGIPTDYFLLLCMNHVMFSITWISSLWHSPPGILVCPHTKALNLFTKHARMDTGCKCN